ncbi:hypothetical protein QR680_001188 [Steinernema hermaphroditum]|uniref:Acetyl-coenzyme A synthetase n=1 Tax=Steinernema hermaphroditum TaxID=289476 RepID=A0AA39GXD9_9BILA|nr:hypothetical protein QR680_001188 [Steinernema hermaphroditum]
MSSKITFTLAPQEEIYEPPASLKSVSYVPDLDAYDTLHRESLSSPNTFWKRYSDQLYFEKRSTNGLEWNFDRTKGPVSMSYMKGSTTNISYNCLERNIERGLGDKVAFFWEGNVPGDEQIVTYNDLFDQVSTFARVLRKNGVKKGDRVAIYLPMIIELPVAMLACARIGAVHSVVFAGFSAQAMASRLVDAHAKMLITCDAYCRGARLFYLKPLADEAVRLASADGTTVQSCLVVDYIRRARLPEGTSFNDKKIERHDMDLFLSEQLLQIDHIDDECEFLDAEDESFILYTSGSTGIAKGIVHTVAGYQTYAFATAQNTFDLQNDDVYFCTADCGWITGHTYIVYGPLLNGVTSVMFEGLPTYPMPDRYWRLIEKYHVTKFYTAPTAIRSLMAYKPEFVSNCDLSSLKIIGTVGEPINAAAWRWLFRVIGNKKCAIADTYWQTETGGHIITSMPSAMPMKPGSAAFPCFGIDAVILDADGKEANEPNKEGMMCVRQAWPGMMRTIAGNHEKFENTYFSFNGYYFTGDGAYRDSDGYIFITGRVDDLMNVSGHLLSTAAIESALTTHEDVVEAAVVGSPHPIKGTTPYAFVTLKNGLRLNHERIAQMKQKVREQIGAISVPEFIQEAPSLPKTRSGKITRRILRKVAEGDRSADLGDTSTLSDKSVIEQLWTGRRSAYAG